MITDLIQEAPEIMRHIESLSRSTLLDLRRLNDGREPLYDEELWESTVECWERYLVKYYYQSNDPIRHFDGLKEAYSIQVAIDTEVKSLTDTLALHIHVELMRIRIILKWHELKEMTEWVPPVDDLWDDMPRKSPLLFTQRELRETMEHLVAKLPSLSMDEHLETFVEHLELKLGMFYCNALPMDRILNDHDMTQTLPTFNGEEEEEDEPQLGVPNRMWLLWASIYHTEAILIPKYYAQLIKEWPPMDDDDDDERPSVTYEQMDATREWAHQLANCPADQLRELKSAAIDEAYRFPGDETWYSVAYPSAPNGRSDIMTQLHEFTYLPPYRMAIGMSLPVLLDQEAETNQLLGSIFVLQMVNHYFKTTIDLEWANCYVLEPQELETAVKRLEFCQDDPFILRHEHRYVILYQRYIIRTRNIFETIALWFEIAKEYDRTTCRAGRIFRNRFNVESMGPSHIGDDDDDDDSSSSSDDDDEIDPIIVAPANAMVIF